MPRVSGAKAWVERGVVSDTSPFFWTGRWACSVCVLFSRYPIDEFGDEAMRYRMFDSRSHRLGRSIPQQARCQKVQISMRSPRIVVIAASPTACAVVRRLLEREWWVVETYLRPLPALTSLWQQASTPPAALILDVDLPHPHLDGYTITHLIRQQAPEGLRSVPIIGLSACDGVIDRIKGRLVGMDAYLTKPFDPAELLLALPGRQLLPLLS